MKHGSLFSGIGGFDLAAEKIGWENLFHCEWNEFGQKVLHYYWPKAEQFTDITKTDFTKYANKIDVLTGGFPCQPYSSAGKRLGKADERHLWPEMLRAIREIKPRWVVGENVYGLVNWNGGMVFEEVQADLEAEGYEVQPYILPAAAVNAPHRRDRVWFVAYANCDGQYQCNCNYEINPSERGQYAQCNTKQSDGDGSTSNTDCDENATNTNSAPIQRRNNSSKERWKRPSKRIESFSEYSSWKEFPTQSPICGRNDGLPTELDGITFPKWRNESIKAYGNAIVPQVVVEIFKAIQAYENQLNQ
jgi:DNA (cytosine-5)-methyltransferase 1